MPSESEINEQIKKQEQVFLQFKNIDINDGLLKGLKTKEDFANALDKARFELQSLVELSRNFDNFRKESELSLFQTIMKPPSDLRMSEKIDIPMNGDLFPWKNRSDLEKILTEYKQWINRGNAENNQVQPTYEYTEDNKIRMSVQEIGQFVCFLSDKHPLELTGFTIYANGAINKKKEKNKKRNKILSTSLMVLAILTMVFSIAMMIFTGSFSFLGIPALKAFKTAEGFTKLGKSMQLAQTIASGVSTACFAIPRGYNFVKQYLKKDRDQSQAKRKFYQEEMKKRAERLNQKIGAITYRINELASKGQSMPGIKKKIEECEKLQDELRSQLGEEKKTNDELRQQNVQLLQQSINNQNMLQMNNIQNQNQQNTNLQPLQPMNALLNDQQNAPIIPNSNKQKIYNQYNNQQPNNNITNSNLNNINNQQILQNKNEQPTNDNDKPKENKYRQMIDDLKKSIKNNNQNENADNAKKEENTENVEKKEKNENNIQKRMQKLFEKSQQQSDNKPADINKETINQETSRDDIRKLS